MKNLVLGILMGLCLSCDNTTVSPDFDSNLVKTFDLWKASNDCKTAKIDEYSYGSDLVYAFDPGMCGADMFTPVADAKGKVFCNLGGIMGNVKCDGQEFEKVAKFKRTVWAAK